MFKQIKQLLTKKPNSASLAKERLKIIVSAERSRHNPNFLEQFKRDLLTVIAKNFQIDIAEIEQLVSLDMGQRNGNATLELNITLPDKKII